MNELYSLNVGRADCHVLFLDTSGSSRRQCLLIDCGWYPPSSSHALISFLKAHHVQVIDLMIITHLHMDHLAALPDLASHLQVKRIIAPTGQMIPVTDAICQTQPGNKYLLHLKAFREALEGCAAKGTIIEDIMDYAQGGSLSFRSARLTCLYPAADSPRPSVDYALKMCAPGLSLNDCIAFENQSRKSANADSSVWLLESGGQQQILFMGDAPMTSIALWLRKGALHPRLLKIPHHGLAKGYFQPAEILALAPEHLLVCADPSKEQAMNDCRCLAERCGASIHFTFDGDFHWKF